MFDGGFQFRVAPGPELAEALAAFPPADASAEDMLEAAVAFERLISWATAGQAAALAGFVRRRPHSGHPTVGESAIAAVDEFAIDEVAVHLCLPKSAAWSRVIFACELERLPLTASALAAGDIDARRAKVLADGTTALPAEVAQAVEQRGIGRAADQTTGQLRASLARAVIAADPRGADQRHEAARSARRVCIRPIEDGMALLWALLPAEGAIAVRHAIERVARADTLPDDPRNMDARRADALIALCSADSLRAAEPRRNRRRSADVRVTIDAATLLRLQESPGTLAGYGPIPPGLARMIAADGAWRRLVTDPANGGAMDLGRRRYRPTAAISDFVKARDVTCRFPGCRRAAEGCDEDHVVPFPLGPTSAANLTSF